MEDSGVLCNRGRVLFLTGNKGWRGLQDGGFSSSWSPNPSVLSPLCCAVSDDSMTEPVAHTRLVG